jgi:hypothetical protein
VRNTWEHPRSKLEDTMKTTTRPYQHSIIEASATGMQVRVVLGTYATLGRAVAAAQRWEGVAPNETRSILVAGHKVRSVYTHGHPRTWDAT